MLFHPGQSNIQTEEGYEAGHGQDNLKRRQFAGERVAAAQASAAVTRCGVDAIDEYTENTHK